MTIPYPSTYPASFPYDSPLLARMAEFRPMHPIKHLKHHARGEALHRTPHPADDQASLHDAYLAADIRDDSRPGSPLFAPPTPPVLLEPPSRRLVDISDNVRQSLESLLAVDLSMRPGRPASDPVRPPSITASVCTPTMFVVGTSTGAVLVMDLDGHYLASLETGSSPSTADRFPLASSQPELPRRASTSALNVNGAHDSDSVRSKSTQPSSTHVSSLRPSLSTQAPSLRSKSLGGLVQFWGGRRVGPEPTQSSQPSCPSLASVSSPFSWRDAQSPVFSLQMSTIDFDGEHCHIREADDPCIADDESLAHDYDVPQEEFLEYVTALATDASGAWVAVGTCLGRLVLWDWVGQMQVSYGQVLDERTGEPARITALAVGARADALYVGTAGGTVLRRARSALLAGFDDTVLFAPGPAMLDSIMGGSSPASLVCREVCHLTLSGPYLFFSLHDTTLVYHERRQRVVARFQRRGPGMAAERRGAADPLLCHIKTIHAPTLRRFIVTWQHDLYLYHDGTDERGSVSRGSSASGSFALAMHKQLPHPIVDVQVQEEAQLLVLTLAQLPAGVTAPGGLGAVCSATPCGPMRYLGEQLRICELVVCTLNLATGCDLIGWQAVAAPPGDYGAWVGLCGTPAGHAGGGGSASAPSLSLSLNANSTTLSRAYLVFQRRVLLVRPLATDERIAWLLAHARHADALHLASRHGRQARRLRVADAYAAHLWRDKRAYAQSVHVTAEYVLPTAGPAYWRELTVRLLLAGRVHLLEPYLPFDDRAALPPDLYLEILLHHLLVLHDHQGVYERVCKWPVVYPIERLADAIAKALHDLETMSFDDYDNDDAADAPQRYLILSLAKLYDFQNRYLEACMLLLQAAPHEAVAYANAHALWDALFAAPVPRALPGVDGLRRGCLLRRHSWNGTRPLSLLAGRDAPLALRTVI